MIVRFVDRRITYDGSQLRAHWILREFGIAGDALVAFEGPCRVLDEEMADLEDLGGPGIRADAMLHFVWERFDGGDLEAAVLRQRLLTCIAAEILRERGLALQRDGDDLFVDARKLSISIATRSLVSTLLHFALNVRNEGTPVATACLDEYGIAPRAFADDLLQRVADEEASIRGARVKVRAKGEA
jgi:hypothetical protein